MPKIIIEVEACIILFGPIYNRSVSLHILLLLYINHILVVSLCVKWWRGSILYTSSSFAVDDDSIKLRLAVFILFSYLNSARVPYFRSFVVHALVHTITQLNILCCGLRYPPVAAERSFSSTLRNWKIPKWLDRERTMKRSSESQRFSVGETREIDRSSRAWMDRVFKRADDRFSIIRETNQKR